MKRTRTVVRRALRLMLGAGAAHAAEPLGVTVYAGAKAEAAAKVVAFYRQQGLQYVGGDAQNAMFKKGETDATVQRPWTDTKTGPLNQTTLVSIVQPAR